MDTLTFGSFQPYCENNAAAESCFTTRDKDGWEGQWSSHFNSTFELPGWMKIKERRNLKGNERNTSLPSWSDFDDVCDSSIPEHKQRGKQQIFFERNITVTKECSSRQTSITRSEVILPLLEFDETLNKSYRSKCGDTILSREACDSIVNPENLGSTIKSNGNPNGDGSMAASISLKPALESKSIPDSSEREKRRESLQLKGLQLEEDNYNKRLLCIVCWTRKIEMTFLPCGHFVTCSVCSDECVSCPRCEKIVLAEAKTYLA